MFFLGLPTGRSRTRRPSSLSSLLMKLSLPNCLGLCVLFLIGSHTSDSAAHGGIIEYGEGNVKCKLLPSQLINLNTCNSKSCGEFFGLFFGRNACKRPEQQKRPAFSTAPLSLVSGQLLDNFLPIRLPFLTSRFLFAHDQNLLFQNHGLFSPTTFEKQDALCRTVTLETVSDRYSCE